jgi:hypothetical protein
VIFNHIPKFEILGCDKFGLRAYGTVKQPRPMNS